MTIQMIRRFIEFVTTTTINGICLGFWMIFIAEVWKWAFGIMKRALLNLFPRLNNLGRNNPKKKKDDKGLVS